MPLATKDGALLAKDGKLQTDCSCCRECQRHAFSVGNLLFRGCGGGGVLYGQKTIIIPDKYPLPCEVTISGFIDDDLAVNGSVVQANQFLLPGYSACNPAHNICYTFTASSSTFTIAAIDNYGQNTSYNLTICFNAGGACCESGVCTIKKECECAGAGKVFMGAGTACSPSPCSPLP